VELARVALAQWSYRSSGAGIEMEKVTLLPESGSELERLNNVTSQPIIDVLLLLNTENGLQAIIYTDYYNIC
jgi:hypothetical protein